mmetsp:Transcript_48558/g.146460  ORF Transcript_48558/g.146460 Transcript_48558/m.146460 type:complete len:266 (+) Transcript_48558:133-930(+)
MPFFLLPIFSVPPFTPSPPPFLAGRRIAAIVGLVPPTFLAASFPLLLLPPPSTFPPSPIFLVRRARIRIGAAALARRRIGPTPLLPPTLLALALALLLLPSTLFPLPTLLLFRLGRIVNGRPRFALPVRRLHEFVLAAAAVNSHASRAPRPVGVGPSSVAGAALLPVLQSQEHLPGEVVRGPSAPASGGGGAIGDVLMPRDLQEGAGPFGVRGGGRGVLLRLSLRVGVVPDRFLPHVTGLERPACGHPVVVRHTHAPCCRRHDES